MGGWREGSERCSEGRGVVCVGGGGVRGVRGVVVRGEVWWGGGGRGVRGVVRGEV